MNSTIQKHSCRPSGAASQASTQASSERGDRERPGLAHGHGAGRQRPLRLVHAVDREVVDLVDRVAGRVEHGRHQRAVEDGQHQRPGDRGLLVAGAPGGDGAREHAQRRRQQRERPREVEIDLQASGAGGRQRRDGGGHRGLSLDVRDHKPRERHGESGADRGVERVQQVVVHPAPPLGDGADDALRQAAEQPRHRDQARRVPPAVEPARGAHRGHERAARQARRASPPG